LNILNCHIKKSTRYNPSDFFFAVLGHKLLNGHQDIFIVDTAPYPDWGWGCSAARPPVRRRPLRPAFRLVSLRHHKIHQVLFAVIDQFPPKKFTKLKMIFKKLNLYSPPNKRK